MPIKYSPAREQLIAAGVIDPRITRKYDFPKLSEAEMRSHMYPANSSFDWRRDVEPFKMPDAWKPDLTP